MPCLAPKPLHLPHVPTRSPMCPHLSLLLHVCPAVLPHLSFHVFLHVLPCSHVPHHMPRGLLCPHMHLSCVPPVPLHILKCLCVSCMLPTPFTHPTKPPARPQWSPVLVPLWLHACLSLAPSLCVPTSSPSCPIPYCPWAVESADSLVQWATKPWGVIFSFWEKKQGYHLR